MDAMRSATQRKLDMTWRVDLVGCIDGHKECVVEVERKEEGEKVVEYRPW
jgi:hypothetical protein